MEADDVKGRQKQTRFAKERFHNGESDESRVGEDQGKLGDLALVQVTEPFAKEKRQYGHEGVQNQSCTHDHETTGQIFIREIGLDQRGDDHHGLADLDDEGGETFGGHVVDDAALAGKKSARHQEKQRSDNG